MLSRWRPVAGPPSRCSVVPLGAVLPLWLERAAHEAEVRGGLRQGRAGHQGERVGDGRASAGPGGEHLVDVEEVEGDAGARDAADVVAGRLGNADAGEVDLGLVQAE